jgi:hypothetical protein
MAHALVHQLRFTRSEFVRGLKGIPKNDARARLQPMNSISWMIGHLAWQEQRYWLYRAQGRLPYPGLNENLAYGKPATTPDLDEIWAIWRAVTEAADPWLDTLTPESIQTPLVKGSSNIGTFLLRTTYHYWYHLGEAMAVRQIQGHPKLPDFVGNIDSKAPYSPE